jgi:hypothetical protein
MAHHLPGSNQWALKIAHGKKDQSELVQLHRSVVATIPKGRRHGSHRSLQRVIVAGGECRRYDELEREPTLTRVLDLRNRCEGGFRIARRRRGSGIGQADSSVFRGRRV